MSIRYGEGNMLDADVDAVVNTVNTNGVMGTGLALRVKQRWPEVNRAYRAACRRGQVKLGSMHIVDRGGLGERPRFVINFPTKDHRGFASRLEDVALGLLDLRQVIDDLRLASVAIPPLGCGLGGLNWNDVQRLIESTLAGIDDVDLVIFPPS